MESDLLPQNKEELKKFVIETVLEVNDQVIPSVSVDEQKEIEEIHQKSLEERYDSKDYVEL